MLSRISSRELTEWQAFYAVEPWAGDAPYYGSAIVAATVANSLRNPKTKAFKPETFIPRFEP